MSYSLSKAVAIMALVVLCLSGCSEEKTSWYFSGDYELVTALQKHSRDRVTVEEIVSFDCHPCYDFVFNGQPELKKQYGDRLTFEVVPLVFNKQTQFPVRLFIIAQQQGKGNDVVKTFFKLRFDDKKDIFDEQTVLQVAQQYGLRAQYEAEKNADWVEKIYQANRARGFSYQISQTPTLVIERQIKATNASLDNVKGLLDDLLK